MRKVVAKLSTAAGYVGALFMIATLLVILVSIFSRLFHVNVRGLDAYAGYCMAAASFLALAYTLHHGEHIRVTLILHHLSARANRVMDIVGYFIAVLISGALAWFSVRLAWQSYTLHDISTGMDATPLWIPQLGMAAGTVLFFLTFLGDFIALMRGEQIVSAKQEGGPAHIE